MRDDNPQAVDQFMAPILPQWMQAFHSILSHHVQGNAEKATAEYGLKMEVLKVKIIKRTYTHVTRVTHMVHLVYWQSQQGILIIHSRIIATIP